MDKNSHALNVNNIIALLDPNGTQRHPTQTGRVATSAATSPTAYFSHRGRRYRIFKRREQTPAELAAGKPGPPWQLAWEWKGKRYLRTLHFPEQRAAIAQGHLVLDDFFDPAKGSVRPSLPTQTQVCSSLGQLFGPDDAASPLQTVFATDASAASRRQYRWAIREVLKFALRLSTNAEADRLTFDVFSADTAERYFARATFDAKRKETPAAEAAFRRHIRCTWRLASGMLGPQALASLRRDCGLVVPDTAPFLAAARALKFRAPRQAAFTAPPAVLLRTLFRHWLALARGRATALAGTPLDDLQRRNVVIASGLMLACGLRCGEVSQLKFSHLSAKPDGTPWLIAPAVRNKKGAAEVTVRPLEPFWSLTLRAIEHNGWRGQPGDYLLAQRPCTSASYQGLRYQHGGHCDRTVKPFVLIRSYLRAEGWGLQKTCHALRDLAASYVTMKFGLTRAKLFCRHESAQTTERSYGRFVREETMDDEPVVLPWLKWACRPAANGHSQPAAGCLQGGKVNVQWT